MKTIRKISELKDCQIRFIVHQFATYQEPSSLKVQFEQLYDLDISTDLLIALNPGIENLCVLDSEWKKYFFTVRAALMKMEFFPEAYNIFNRLELLESMLKGAEKENDKELVLKILEQFRKETQAPYDELVQALKIKDPVSHLRKKFEA